MSPIKPLVARSAVDEVADSLRERVLTEEIAPGGHVTEIHVANHYGVARPTARAAIDRLVQQGLFRRSAHKSARVPLLAAEDVNDLYFARSCLEREIVAALAARRAVPPGAHAALADLSEVAPTERLLDVVDADIAFHRALVGAVGSARLTRVYNSLMGEVRLCMAQVQSRHLLTPSSIGAEHSGIIDVINSGDASRAVALVTEHLEHARAALLQNLAARQSDVPARRGPQLTREPIDHAGPGL